MTAAKSFFQDRLVLLLLSVNAFVAFLTTLLILFRVGSGTGGFIVQYRENLGISAYKPGSAINLLAFIGFAVIVFASQAVLSWRSYHIRRQLALAILALGVVLLVLCIIVSNALLALR